MAISEPTNFVSSKHPHEPEQEPIYDPEGRCLVCSREHHLEVIASLEARLESFQQVAGHCGFENADGTVAVVSGDVALHLARQYEPFPIYRKV